MLTRKEEIQILKQNSIARIEQYPLLYNDKERVIQRIKDLHKMKLWAMKFFGKGYEKVHAIDAELFAFRQKLLELKKR